MLPAEILDRFRVLSLERVGRLEAAWNRAILEGTDVALVRAMLREVHTQKGDASIVGSSEVLILCGKLEDLISAIGPDFTMSEDFELVVTMAIQFLGMLLRMRPGAASGVDLGGFVQQVDDVLRVTRAAPVRAARTVRPPRPLPELSVDRLGEAMRRRLADAATTVFLESIASRSPRLRGAWRALRGELARLEAADLRPLLARHVAPAQELASGLGKNVEIELAVDAGVEPRVAEAIDVAVLHIVRNAIDHGIEEPAARLAASKRGRGTVRVTATARDGILEVSIADDGRGIDVAAVRAAAVASGRLEARDMRDAEVLDLVFAPGLSTRAAVTELSGRGVGLDAVRSAITRVGGDVRIATGARGTTVTLAVPAPVRHLPAYEFLAPGGLVGLAVSARWAPDLGTPREAAIDPLQAIDALAGPREPAQVAFSLRWGFCEVALRAATEPRLVTAERICPTSDDHPVEVVLVDGRETLLLRPEHIGELAAAWSKRKLPRATTSG